MESDVRQWKEKVSLQSRLRVNHCHQSLVRIGEGRTKRGEAEERGGRREGKGDVPVLLALRWREIEQPPWDLRWKRFGS